MPSSAEVHAEILELIKHNEAAPYDRVRQKYLLRCSKYTKRPTLLYCSKHTQPSLGQVPADFTTITLEDLYFVENMVQDIDGETLDIILHSPGGSYTAVEALVISLRKKFKNIRVIVPNASFSAATMLACAADSIIMGNCSFLGPIDPQIPYKTALGMRWVAAKAIMEQYKQAQEELKDEPKLSLFWNPILEQYGPEVLVECRQACMRAEGLVKDWLGAYMFKDYKKTEKEDISDKISKWLGNYNDFKTHARPIPACELKAKGLKIIDMEADQKLKDAVLSVYHTCTATFDHTSIVKLVSNHIGQCIGKSASPVK